MQNKHNIGFLGSCIAYGMVHIPNITKSFLKKKTESAEHPVQQSGYLFLIFRIFLNLSKEISFLQMIYLAQLINLHLNMKRYLISLLFLCI